MLLIPRFTQTDIVPDDAFDQLDKALNLLNEKSEENGRLHTALIDKEKERLLRELEFQNQFKELDDAYRQDLSQQKESEDFFKRVYLQASEMHKDAQLLLDETLAEKEVLKRQVETGVSQVREHFTGQISQLRAELHSAKARADLFMEQASRTESIRRDTGEAPMLRMKVARLSKELSEALEKARSSEDTAVVANMCQEVVRLMSVEQGCGRSPGTSKMS
jgi:hypothetical protein